MLSLEMSFILYLLFMALQPCPHHSFKRICVYTVYGQPFLQEKLQNGYKLVQNLNNFNKRLFTSNGVSMVFK